MKKKIISLSLVMVMLMGLSACSNKPTAGTTSKAAETSAAKSVEESSSSDNNSSAVSSAASDDELKDYNRVSVVEYEKMYINYHKKHHPNNFSHGFYYEDRTVKERICIPVLVTYDDEVFGKPFAGELKDIFDVYNNGDIFEAANRTASRGSINSEDKVIITLDSSEETTVNGIDTIHFKGHASYDKTSDRLLNFYVTGYTFIFNGKPYMLVGVIFGEQDGDNLRDSLDKEIDCMMKTVRSEKEKEGIFID